MVGEAGGTIEVVIEAKFWAGFGTDQPAAYLDYLPKARPGVLVVIVPGGAPESVLALVVQADGSEWGTSAEHVDACR